jgi:tRNA 2-thiouridine synthesizing protein A
VTSQGAGLTIDSRATVCPQPVIDLAQAMGHVEIGDALTLLADDPAAAFDIPAWCRMKGHALISTSDDDGVFTFVVTRSH